MDQGKEEEGDEYDSEAKIMHDENGYLLAVV